MLIIDTLSLQLPAGFEARAERIGRLVGDALARIDPGAELRLPHLALPAIAIAPGASDAAVATSIADAVRHHLTTADRQGER